MQGPHMPVVAFCPLMPSCVSRRSQAVKPESAHTTLGTFPPRSVFLAMLNVFSDVGKPLSEEDEGNDVNWFAPRLSSIRAVNPLRSGTEPDSEFEDRSSVVRDDFIPDDAAENREINDCVSPCPFTTRALRPGSAKRDEGRLCPR